MSRQVKWRKVFDQNTWVAKPMECYHIDCKLTIYAGIGGSVVANQNAKLEVAVPIEGQYKKYRIIYIKEFRTSWHAKEIIDCILTMLCYSNNGNIQWFIDRLNDLKIIDKPLPSTGAYHHSSYVM